MPVLLELMLQRYRCAGKHLAGTRDACRDSAAQLRDGFAPVEYRGIHVVGGCRIDLAAREAELVAPANQPSRMLIDSRCFIAPALRK